MRIISDYEADYYHQLLCDKNRIDLIESFNNGIINLPFRYYWVDDLEDVNYLSRYILLRVHKYVVEGKLLIPFSFYLEDGGSDFNILETQTIFLKQDLTTLLNTSSCGYEIILIEPEIFSVF